MSRRASSLLERRPPVGGQTVAHHLRAGLAHHRAGELTLAGTCYARILASNPEHADALNLTGILARQHGELERSERLIRRAIAHDAQVATYHHNLARTLVLQGEAEGAAESFARALELNPQDLESLQMLAELLRASGKSARALELERAAVGLMPGSFADVFGLATHLAEAGCFAESAEYFHRCARLRPEDGDSYNGLGRALHELGETAAAREAYSQAIRLNPESVESLSNFGALMMELGELRTAEVLLRRAIELNPDFLNAHSNLGCLMEKLGNPLAAVECFGRVLAGDAGHVPSLCNLGLTLDNLGDGKGARQCYRLALERDPANALARFNLSLHHLADGEFATGWREYEHRWQTRQFFGKRTALPPEQLWVGQDLTGSRIFVYAEQGLGDTLQFVRFIPGLVEMGAEVTMEVQPELCRLLAGMHPGVRILAKGEPVGEFDWHSALMSLPIGFASDLTNLPGAGGYLASPEMPGAAWRQELVVPGVRVGMVWSGNPKHTRDKARSIALAQFMPLAKVAGVSLFSLQKGPAQGQLGGAEGGGDRIVDLGPYLNDFSDTAAILGELDLVIAVDTSVAHLAGALGCPVWLLIPQPADWRWLRDRTDSPWYGSARLFRQTVAGDWGPVMAEVIEALGARASGSSKGVA